MKCEEMDQLINKYLEGNLCDENINTVNEHLNSCNKCMKNFKQMSNIFNLLNDYPLIEPPIGFADRIMSAIHIEQSNINTNHFVQNIFAKSLIVAGIALSVINIFSFNTDVFNFSSSLLKFSSDISEFIFAPITKISSFIIF